MVRYYKEVQMWIIDSLAAELSFSAKFHVLYPVFPRFCEQPPDWSECTQRHLAEHVRLYKCKKVTELLSLFQTTAE